MRVAVIDCGTNTFNLLIVETNANERKKLFNSRTPVKLGEGSINKGFIGAGPFTRAIEAIDAFSSAIKEYQVEKTLAFATSAVRDAANGRELVDTIFSRTGIAVQVIDGAKEAMLIYLGVRDAVNMSDSPSLIMDIGGGSTEFIIASKQQIFWKQSFNIGAARLLEMFKPSNPITSTEITLIIQFLTHQLAALFPAVARYNPTELLGSSGAFDSVIEMIHGELGGEPLQSEKTEYHVKPENYTFISQKVIASTLEERRKIKGLVPMRFDMIVISCLMMNFVLDKFSLNRIRVSTYSLKEGALAEFLMSH